MKYDVISAFLDRRTGQTIEAGSPVPAGLDRQTVKRLVQARCLEPIEEPKTATSQTQLGSAAAPSLFPETDAGGTDDAGEGEDDEGEAASEPQPAPPAPTRPKK
jgi:hypothetical protein